MQQTKDAFNHINQLSAAQVLGGSGVMYQEESMSARQSQQGLPAALRVADQLAGHLFKLVCLQVVTVAWVTSTVFFLACWVGECKPLPSARHLSFYEMDGDEQDIYAGVDSVDPSGLKHFPRLW